MGLLKGLCTDLFTPRPREKAEVCKVPKPYMEILLLILKYLLGSVVTVSRDGGAGRCHFTLSLYFASTSGMCSPQSHPSWWLGLPQPGVSPQPHPTHWAVLPQPGALCSPTQHKSSQHGGRPHTQAHIQGDIPWIPGSEGQAGLVFLGSMGLKQSESSWQAITPRVLHRQQTETQPQSSYNHSFKTGRGSCFT